MLTVQVGAGWSQGPGRVWPGHAGAQPLPWSLHPHFPLTPLSASAFPWGGPGQGQLPAAAARPRRRQLLFLAAPRGPSQRSRERALCGWRRLRDAWPPRHRDAALRADGLGLGRPRPGYRQVPGAEQQLQRVPWRGVSGRSGWGSPRREGWGQRCWAVAGHVLLTPATSHRLFKREGMFYS